MSIELNAFEKFSYGMFLLTAHFDGKHNGCIINTATQITSTGQIIVSVAVNKNSYTCQMINESKAFCLSVLTKSASFDLFKRFGFSSGKDTDKFDGFSDFDTDDAGIRFLTSSCCAAVSCVTEKAIDCDTHMLFIARVTSAKKISDEDAATYEYYLKNIKPAAKKEESKKSGYVCRVCGYIYEGDTLPDDFVCPLCKHPASDFEKL